MKYCDKCKVSVAGERNYCPLCQSALIDKGGPSEEAYPLIPTIYHQYNLFFRILIFASVVAVVISVAVNFLFHAHGWWSIFVAAGIGCVWLSLYIAVRKRRNIPQNILWQVVAIIMISMLWDYCTGWHRWSVNYVVPFACISGMAAVTIVIKVMYRYIDGHMIYFILDGLLGLIPLIFLLFGRLEVLFPSMISVCTAIISLTALVLFKGQSLKGELKRRLHF